MTQQSLFDPALGDRCPRCGSMEVTSMEELKELVTTAAYQFAPDISDWIMPPESPRRPVPRKRRVAVRNSIAFGVALVIALFVTVFALTGSLPSWPFWVIILSLGCSVGTRTWRTDSMHAEEEEAMLLETHAELYRAFLNRRKVWSRLRYCCKCSMVTDPVTLQTRTIYEIHELANSRVNGVSLR